VSLWLEILLYSYAGFFVLFVWLEIFSRTMQKGRFSKSDLDNLLVYNKSPSEGVPFEKLHFRLYGKGTKLLAKSDTRLNNKGLVSVYDYHPTYDEDTYRIVVMGGEQAASALVEKCWPDFLQDKLNGLSLGKKFEVYNIACPELRLEDYLEHWRQHGKAFKPHLVLFDIAEKDYLHVPLDRRFFYKSNQSAIRFVFGEDESATLPVIWRGGTAPPATTLSDKRAHLKIPLQLCVSEPLLDAPAKITALQQQFIRERRRRENPWGYYAWLWLCAPKRLSVNATVRDQWTFYSGIEKSMRVKNRPFSLERVKELKKEIKNLSVIHTFSYTACSKKHPYSLSRFTEKAGIEIADMRSFITKSIRHLESLYLHPILPGQWSLSGHRFYADVVANYLTKTGILKLTEKI